MRLRRASMVASGSLLLLLTGCALPVPVAMTSYAVDGIFLMGTGKTVTDHALSAATDQDCRLWRAMGDKPVCMDPAVPEVGPATGDPAGLVAVTTAQPVPQTPPRPTVAAAPAAVAVAMPPPPARPATLRQTAGMALPPALPEIRKRAIQVAAIPLPPRPVR